MLRTAVRPGRGRWPSRQRCTADTPRGRWPCWSSSSTVRRSSRGADAGERERCSQRWPDDSRPWWPVAASSAWRSPGVRQVPASTSASWMRRRGRVPRTHARPACLPWLSPATARWYGAVFGPPRSSRPSTPSSPRRTGVVREASSHTRVQSHANAVPSGRCPSGDDERPEQQHGLGSASPHQHDRSCGAVHRQSPAAGGSGRTPSVSRSPHRALRSAGTHRPVRSAVPTSTPARW